MYLPIFIKSIIGKISGIFCVVYCLIRLPFRIVSSRVEAVIVVLSTRSVKYFVLVGCIRWVLPLQSISCSVSIENVHFDWLLYIPQPGGVLVSWF